MSRPLSDRRHDVPDRPDDVFETRIWVEAGGSGDGHWRTIAVSAEQEDATTVASALVSTGGPIAYAEVWGPGRDAASHRVVVERFPTPSHEERQEMWLRAADENYSTSYSDIKH